MSHLSLAEVSRIVGVRDAAEDLYETPVLVVSHIVTEVSHIVTEVSRIVAHVSPFSRKCPRCMDWLFASQFFGEDSALPRMECSFWN